MNERFYAALLAAVIISLFALVVTSTWRANDALVDRYESEQQLHRMVDRCDIDTATGAAICKPHTFPAPTTSTSHPVGTTMNVRRPR